MIVDVLTFLQNIVGCSDSFWIALNSRDNTAFACCPAVSRVLWHGVAKGERGIWKMSLLFKHVRTTFTYQVTRFHIQLPWFVGCCAPLFWNWVLWSEGKYRKIQMISWFYEKPWELEQLQGSCFAQFVDGDPDLRFMFWVRPRCWLWSSAAMWTNTRMQNSSWENWGIL